jgi:hypothetical protein
VAWHITARSWHTKGWMVCFRSKRKTSQHVHGVLRGGWCFRSKRKTLSATFFGPLKDSSSMLTSTSEPEKGPGQYLVHAPCKPTIQVTSPT